MSDLPARSWPRPLLLATAFGVVAALGALTLWFWLSRTCCAPSTVGPIVAVPSGQEVRYLDTITNVPGQSGLTYRFRFVAPAIGTDGGMTSTSSQDDMQALCETFALPRLPETGPRPNQVIISLAAEETPFGRPAPNVMQFFEAYDVSDGTCVWDLF